MSYNYQWLPLNTITCDMKFVKEKETYDMKIEELEVQIYIKKSLSIMKFAIIIAKYCKV